MPLALSSLLVNVGNWANRNSPFVCTGPLKFVVLENQTGPPVGELWTSVNNAYIEKLWSRSWTLKFPVRTTRRRNFGGTCPSLVTVYL